MNNTSAVSDRNISVLGKKQVVFQKHVWNTQGDHVQDRIKILLTTHYTEKK